MNKYIYIKDLPRSIQAFAINNCAAGKHPTYKKWFNCLINDRKPTSQTPLIKKELLFLINGKVDKKEIEQLIEKLEL